jgi:hypothetical protein
MLRDALRVWDDSTIARNLAYGEAEVAFSDGDLDRAIERISKAIDFPETLYMRCRGCESLEPIAKKSADGLRNRLAYFQGEQRKREMASRDALQRALARIEAERQVEARKAEIARQEEARKEEIARQEKARKLEVVRYDAALTAANRDVVKAARSKWSSPVPPPPFPTNPSTTDADRGSAGMWTSIKGDAAAFSSSALLAMTPHGGVVSKGLGGARFGDLYGRYVVGLWTNVSAAIQALVRGDYAGAQAHLSRIDEKSSDFEAEAKQKARQQAFSGAAGRLAGERSLDLLSQPPSGN